MFDDVDVTAEHERVLSGEADEDLLRLENLTKVGLLIQKSILYTRLFNDYSLGITK